MSGPTYPNLKRGDMVQATADFDPDGANVKAGMWGVCFEEANFYGDGGGPMVRWQNGGCCNVYDDFVKPGSPPKG